MFLLLELFAIFASEKLLLMFGMLEFDEVFSR